MSKDSNVIKCVYTRDGLLFLPHDVYDISDDNALQFVCFIGV